MRGRRHCINSGPWIIGYGYEQAVWWYWHCVGPITGHTPLPPAIHRKRKLLSPVSRARGSGRWRWCAQVPTPPPAWSPCPPLRGSHTLWAPLVPSPQPTGTLRLMITFGLCLVSGVRQRVPAPSHGTFSWLKTPSSASTFKTLMIFTSTQFHVYLC